MGSQAAGTSSRHGHTCSNIDSNSISNSTINDNNGLIINSIITFITNTNSRKNADWGTDCRTKSERNT